MIANDISLASALMLLQHSCGGILRTFAELVPWGGDPSPAEGEDAGGGESRVIGNGKALDTWQNLKPKITRMAVMNAVFFAEKGWRLGMLDQPLTVQKYSRAWLRGAEVITSGEGSRSKSWDSSYILVRYRVAKAEGYDAIGKVKYFITISCEDGEWLTIAIVSLFALLQPYSDHYIGVVYRARQWGDLDYPVMVDLVNGKLAQTCRKIKMVGESIYLIHIPVYIQVQSLMLARKDVGQLYVHVITFYRHIFGSCSLRNSPFAAVYYTQCQMFCKNAPCLFFSPHA